MLFKWSLCFMVALALAPYSDATITKCRPKTDAAAPTGSASSIDAPPAGSQSHGSQGGSQWHGSQGGSQWHGSQGGSQSHGAPSGSNAGSQAPPPASSNTGSQGAPANSNTGSQGAPANSNTGSQGAPANSNTGSQGAPANSQSQAPPASSNTNDQSSTYGSSNNAGSQPAAGSSGGGSGPYSVVDNWSGNNFFNGWDFFNGADPTHGSVQYMSQGDATSQNLAYVNPAGQAIMRADNTTTGNRKSVRISTQKTYTGGLFVIDLEHLPTGVGTWPAFWTFGPNWPNSGEIDILEGVSNSQTNQYTLHTGNQNGGCQMPVGDCYGNMGCDIKDSRTISFGDAFNQNGGGVYAMLWNNDAIQMWFFPRDSIPSDLSNGLNPDPTGWNAPVASFPNNPSCNIASNFANHQIIINLTFCGDWAGSVVPDCVNQVTNNPGQYSEAYWQINYVRTFQKNN